MMKLTLADSKILKDSISIISELVNEANFKINKNGVELIAMDPANVAMVIFKLLSSNFTEYSIKQDMSIAINLDNLKQVLRRASPTDMITLELEDKNKLKIVLRGNTLRTFNIPLIEMEDKEQKIPDLKFSAVVKTDSSILNNAIEDADIVSESVNLQAEPSKFSVLAEGDLSKASIEIKESDNTVINVEGATKIKSKYSIEYLKKMIAGAKVSDKVDIMFNKDYPLRLNFTALDKASLSFILAPRVEND